MLLMLASSNLKITRKSVVPFDDSDHLALFADIRLPKIRIPTKRRRLIVSTLNAKQIHSQQEKQGKWTRKSSIIKKVFSIINHPDNYGVWNGQRHKVWRRKRYPTQRAKKYSLIELLKLKSTDKWQIINKYFLRKAKPIDWSNPLTIESKDNWLKNFSTWKPGYADQPSNIPGKLTIAEINSIGRMRFKTSSLAADNFTPKTWSKFFEINKTYIINVISEMFTFSHIPQAVVTLGCGFVPKPDGTSLRMVKSPNFLYKIIDRILKDRILQSIEKLVDLRFQFGYIPETSRHDMIFSIINHPIYKATSAVIQLDVTKAFDTVLVNTALNKIDKHMDTSTAALIRSTVTERYLIYNDKQGKRYHVEIEGVPQGTSTGPLLFIIALDEALKQLHEYGLAVWAYADDIVILLDQLQQRQELVILEKVSTVLSKLNLTLNMNKTKVTPFNRSCCIEILGEKIYKIFRHTVYQRDLFSSLSDAKESFNYQWHILPYLPVKIKNLILCSIIIPTLATHEFALIITSMQDSEVLDKRLQHIIVPWGRLLKLVMEQGRRSHNIVSFIQYSQQFLLRKLEAALRIQALNTGTTGQPTRGKHLPSMRMLTISREQKNPIDTTVYITNGTKGFVQIITTTNDCTYIDDYNRVLGISPYETQLILLEIVLLKSYNVKIVIVKTKEMTSYGMGDSNFAKGMDLLMWKHKDGFWTWRDFVQHPVIDNYTLTHHSLPLLENRLSILRQEKIKARDIYERAWRNIQSIWPTLYPSATCKLITRLWKVENALKFHLDRQLSCCGAGLQKDNRSTLKHLLTECPLMREEMMKHNLNIDENDSRSFNALLNDLKNLKWMAEALRYLLQ